MESIIAEPRTVAGKAVKSLRAKGFLPAVVYGKGEAAESISVPQAEFMKLWKSAGESTLVSLKLGKNEKNVLIHEVALDPIKNKPLHVDFYLVDMKKEVEIDVPIEFVGEAEAGKSSGGILVKVMHELKVKCLPQNLPHNIIVDVSKLQESTDSISVSDIKLPAEVSIINDANDLIAMIEEVRASEPEAEEAAVTAEDAIKNIEVVKEKKPEEEESEDKE